MSASTKRRLKRAMTMLVVYAILILVTMLIVYPFIWMVLTSMRTSNAEIWSTDLRDMIPRRLTLEAYRGLTDIGTFSVYRLAANSFIFSLGATLVNALCCTLAAYALTNPKLILGKVLLLFFLTMMIVPQELVAVPVFLTVHSLKMLNTYRGVILALSAEGFAILILYRFFAQLPTEITEAARIDGANELQLLWRIVLPLARPAIGTVVLLQFIMAWNAFMMPLILTSDDKMLNLQVAMAHFNTQFSIDFRAIMAVGSIITIPVLVIFILTQRTLIRGITAGAVK